MQVTDPFIGKTFPTPKGGIITVSSIAFHRDYPVFFVSCSVCSEDEELWPHGYMKSYKGDLVGGHVPCGCAKVPKWNKDQNIIRAKRKCESSGIEFIGINGGYTGVKTKLILSCKIHGEWSNTTIASLLGGVSRTGCGCRKCSYKSNTMSIRRPDSEMVEIFISTGGFAEGTSFRRHSTLQKWSVTCPACSSDEFALAGVGRNEFESTTCSLRQGHLPCRCSKTRRLTIDEWEFLICRAADKDGYKFVRWVDSQKIGRHADVVIECSMHGEFVSGVDRFIGQSCRCPGCAAGGFDQTSEGYLYALRSDCGAYLKVGISNYPNDRIPFLSRRTPFAFVKQSEIKFDIGLHARNLERDTHKAFESAGLRGFDGATEWLKYDPAIIEYIQQRA